MKKIIFTLIILFFNQILVAQKIIDIKADFIDLNNSPFIFYEKLKDNLYKEKEILIEEIGEYTYKISIEEQLYKNFVVRKRKEIIKVDTLPNINIKCLKKKMSGTSFVDKDDDDIIQFNYFNDYYFSMREYELDDNNITTRSDDTLELIDTEYYRYFILRINKKKLIIVFLKRYEANIGRYIIPIKSSFITDYFSEDLLPINNSNLEKMNWNIPFKNKYAYIDSDFDYLYKIDTIHNQLKDGVLNQNVLKQKFDRLSIKKGFIIGNSDKIHIYNLKLDEITPKNTRAVQWHNKNYCRVLINNKLKWLDRLGNIFDTVKFEAYMVCGTVVSYKDEILTSPKGYFIIEKSNRYFTDGNNTNNTNNKYFLFLRTKYDEVTFLNGSGELYYDENDFLIYNKDDYRYPTTYNYLRVKKSNKYGLIQINTKNNIINKKIILPIEYEFIEEAGYQHWIRYKKNGLYGYYSLNKQAKYKNISRFEMGFARFVLPNKKMGWLDVNGNEYIDK
ncbi:MAG: hypothetical protein L3J23_04795 [Flavobacteriaceae bacterium]|nr:hypothetical protein [Flavobacteriaceae bacterium]